MSHDRDTFLVLDLHPTTPTSYLGAGDETTMSKSTLLVFVNSLVVKKLMGWGGDCYVTFCM